MPFLDVTCVFECGGTSQLLHLSNALKLLCSWHKQALLCVVASTRCTVTTLLPILHPVYACGQTVALVQCTQTALLLTLSARSRLSYLVALVQCTATALFFVNRLSLVASVRCTDTDSVPGFLLRLKSRAKNQGTPTCPQMYPQKCFCWGRTFCR